VANSTYATVISTVWRLLSYYVYLFAGAVLVPNWIRKVLRKK
jgi:glycosyltransferase 2 family protein